MRSRFVRLIGAGLCLGLFASSAAACINDRESDKAEKEFKSHYLQQQPAKIPETVSPLPPPQNPVLTIGGTSVGVMLLIGAFTMTARQRQRRL